MVHKVIDQKLYGNPNKMHTKIISLLAFKLDRNHGWVSLTSLCINSFILLAIHEIPEIFQFIIIIIIVQVTYNQVQPCIVNQLPGQLVSTQIRTIGLNCFNP